MLFSLRSDRKLTVRGAEGVEVEGKKVSLTAAEDILVSSEQGSVVLEAGAGLVLDTVTWNHICFFSFSYLLFPEGDAPSRRGPGLLRGGGPVQALRLPSLGPRVQGERKSYSTEIVTDGLFYPHEGGGPRR